MIWRERNFKFDPNYEEEVSNLKRMGKFSTFSDKILTPSSKSWTILGVLSLCPQILSKLGLITGVCSGQGVQIELNIPSWTQSPNCKMGAVFMKLKTSHWKSLFIFCTNHTFDKTDTIWWWMSLRNYHWMFLEIYQDEHQIKPQFNQPIKQIFEKRGKETKADHNNM